MLQAALRLGDAAMRAQALDTIGYIAANARNPRTGLLYESWGPEGWHNRGWWFDGMHTRGHSGYLAGQSAYYLLKAADWDERLGGTAHPDWVALAGSVVARLNAAKNGDGEYPFILSEETGAGLEYDSMGSAWCLAAAALYAKLTGDRSGLEEMARSEAHYYEAFVARGECYGGPLDTDKAVDSEGVLAYIRAARLLHELTGEEVYLRHLRDALAYEFTYKLCYNSPLAVPPLGRIGWRAAAAASPRPATRTSTRCPARCSMRSPTCRRTRPTPMWRRAWPIRLPGAASATTRSTANTTTAARAGCPSGSATAKGCRARNTQTAARPAPGSR